MKIFYYLFYFILWICGSYDYSLNLSRNGKIESEIKMECAYSSNALYCINVYILYYDKGEIKDEGGWCVYYIFKEEELCKFCNSLHHFTGWL